MPPPVKECPECGVEMYAMQLPRHLFSEHGIGEKPGGGRPKRARATAAPETAPDLHVVEELPVEDPPTPDVTEQAPRKPKLLDRIRSRRGRGRPGGPSPVPVSGERPPRRGRPSRGRRVALDGDISDLWAFAGRRLEASPHYPTGRMLKYQAPAAGIIIDRAIAGTLPDRVLFQPIARGRDKYEDVAFLLAGPLLTFSITTTMYQLQAAQSEGDAERYEELATKLTVQREMFTWVLSAMLPRLAAGKRVADEKAAKRDAAIAEAFPDLGGEDPVEVLADMLFAPPPSYREAGTNGKPDPTPADPHREGAVPFGG